MNFVWTSIVDAQAIYGLKDILDRRVVFGRYVYPSRFGDGNDGLWTHVWIGHVGIDLDGDITWPTFHDGVRDERVKPTHFAFASDIAKP